MSRRRGEPMRFGATSLSRLHCTTCDEVTLHRYHRCIHCGELAPIETWRRPQLTPNELKRLGINNAARRIA